MIVKKQDLVDLIKEVALPFSEYIANTKEGKKYLKTKEQILRLQHSFAMFSVALILQKKSLIEELINKAVEDHKKIGLSTDELEKAAKKFFSLLKEFVNKKFNDKELINEICEYRKIFLNKHSLKESECESADDFFDFDSEFELDEINNMHYEDKRKISAREFMKEETIDNEMIEEMKEIVEEMHILFEKDSINKEYIEELLKILNSFIKVFNLSVEFRNLAYNLEQFREIILNKLRNAKNKELLKALIESILEDLKKWFESVVIKQEALDIHYLDASLLANISQIEIFLKEQDES